MASLKLEGLQRGDARLVLHLLKLLEDALVAPTHFGRLSMNAIDVRDVFFFFFFDT